MQKQRKGGLARADALSQEQRTDIAKKAAIARWGERPLKATHKGNFKKEFGIDVECYVLDDEANTAVISQRGMAELLGFSEGGSKLTRFLEGDRIAPLVGPGLKEELENPIIFQGLKAGPDLNVAPAIHGYPGGALTRLCWVIVKADQSGILTRQQKHIAERASTIIQATSELGIRDLVYAISGFDSTKEKTINAFRDFVRRQAREWEKEIPLQLYDEWYRLYQLPRTERSRPWIFCKITRDHVWLPLAQSNGAIYKLVRDRRDEVGKRHTTRLHQFLSELGLKVFRRHVGSVLGIAQISDTPETYAQNTQKWLERQQGDPISEEELNLLIGEEA
jgi:hypothetical protein